MALLWNQGGRWSPHHPRVCRLPSSCPCLTTLHPASGEKQRPSQWSPLSSPCPWLCRGPVYPRGHCHVPSEMGGRWAQVLGPTPPIPQQALLRSARHRRRGCGVEAWGRHQRARAKLRSIRALTTCTHPPPPPRSYKAGGGTPCRFCKGGPWRRPSPAQKKTPVAPPPTDERHKGAPTAGGEVAAVGGPAGGDPRTVAGGVQVGGVLDPSGRIWPGWFLAALVTRAAMNGPWGGGGREMRRSRQATPRAGAAGGMSSPTLKRTRVGPCRSGHGRGGVSLLFHPSDAPAVLLPRRCPLNNSPAG